MRTARVPLNEEPIDGAATVANYDRYAALFMRPEYRLTARQILRCGIKTGRVLDIGTGSGRLALELAKNKTAGFDIVGLDVSPGMLKTAHANIAAGKAANITCIQATAAHLPFADESFEIVTSYASLHHWQQPAAVFDEIWRVTKKNGLILIRDNRRMLGNPFYRGCVWTLSLFMSKAERGRWPKSILASYSLDEVRAILAQTQMRNYKVRADMGGFDLAIEARKD